MNTLTGCGKAHGMPEFGICQFLTKKKEWSYWTVAMVIIERYHRPLLKLTKGKTINKGNKLKSGRNSNHE